MDCADLQITAVPVGAGLPAISGKAGAIHRIACKSRTQHILNKPRHACCAMIRLYA